MSNINKDVAEKVLRSIFANEAGHAQAKWLSVPDHPRDTFTVVNVGTMEAGTACGTTACIAGWAALHAGWSLKVEKDDGNFMGRWVTVVSPDGDEALGLSDVNIDMIGRQALGLGALHATSIFWTLDEHAAIARLYSLLKTDDVIQLVADNGAEETYLQAKAEFSPVLDVLDTLSEPEVASIS